MKKFISIILVSVLMSLLFAGCNYRECDLCGEKGFVNERTLLGTTIYLCDDCN